MAKSIALIIATLIASAAACGQMGYGMNPMMMCPMMNPMMMMNGGCGCSNNNNMNMNMWGNNNGQVMARVCTNTNNYNEGSIRSAIASHFGIVNSPTSIVFSGLTTANGQNCVDVTANAVTNWNQVPSYCQTVQSALPAVIQGASVLSVTCNNHNNMYGCNNQWGNNNNWGGCGCNNQWNHNGNFMTRICATGTWNEANVRTAIANHMLVPNNAQSVMFGAVSNVNGQNCADVTVMGATDMTRKSQMCTIPLPSSISGIGIVSSSCSNNNMYNNMYNNNGCNSGCNMNMMNMNMMNQMMMMNMMNPMMMGGMGGMMGMGGMNPMMMGGMNPMMMGMGGMMGGCP